MESRESKLQIFKMSN